jgi:hypothetical protein
MREARKATTKKANPIQANSPNVLGIPPIPNMAAIIATKKKASVKLSIADSRLASSASIYDLLART